jgi:UDP-glucose 4-epimerase
MADLMLVTGGAGFIGSHLVDGLLERGFAVRVLDDFSTGRRANLEHVARDIELIEGDICDFDTCRGAARGARAVFHLAAQGSVPKSVADPFGSNANNVMGTLNMLEAAREQSVDRFVFAASSAAYGNTEVLPKTEAMRPQPLSPYAAQKVTGEHFCTAWWESYRLPTVSLRYFNIFGPRQRPDGPYAAVIPAFFAAVARHEPPLIHGDGGQTRDFTFVKNAVDANLQALDAGAAAFGRVFNVAGGERISINALFDAIAALRGTDLRPLHGPARVGDVRDSLADLTSASEILGYSPRIHWRDGLAQTAEYFL